MSIEAARRRWRQLCQNFVRARLCAGAAWKPLLFYSHIYYTQYLLLWWFTRQEKTQTHFTEARAPAPTPAPSRRSPRPPRRHPRSPPSTALCLQLCARRRYPLLAPARRPKSAPARIHPRGSAWCPRAVRNNSLLHGATMMIRTSS